MICSNCKKKCNYLKKEKCERCYRKQRQLSFGYSICECGCGNQMPKLNAHLQPMRFIKGHNKIKFKFLKQQLIECECGCKELIPLINTNNKFARFKIGHNIKQSIGWKGGRIINTQGYILIYCPKHLYCDKRGYVREHRLIYEAYLTKLNGIKTYIHPSIIIHHIDGNKQNNVLSNLVLTTQKEHLVKYHYDELISRLP